MYKNLSKNAP
jgi:hypothetical protein